MRYELARGPGKPKMWYVIDIMPVAGDEFAVVMTYGMTDPQGDDAVIQKLKSIYQGTYQEATNVLLAKIQNREKIGYTKIEPKSDE